MTQSSPSQSRKPSGFTLVELMVVMMILGILVAMAVGIGNIVIEGISRQETAEYQRIVISAVSKFHGIKGRLPKRLEMSWDGVAGLNFGDNPDCRMRTLVFELSSVQACADIYAQLPQRAFESAGTGTT
ncbi:MAG: type II secretion system protein, partial [Planctomycetota bacterium]